MFRAAFTELRNDTFWRLWGFFFLLLFLLPLSVSTAAREAQLWVMFCSKSLDTTSGTAVANEATTFLLHSSHFGRRRLILL